MLSSGEIATLAWLFVGVAFIFIGVADWYVTRNLSNIVPIVIGIGCVTVGFHKER